MKKALSLILVLVMLVGMMPMTAFATEKDHGRLSLEGLNVLCLGDSITAGQGLTTETRWTNVLASKYGWNLTNKSQGGISLSSYYYTANGKSDVSIAKKAEILKTMTTKPDVIIVWGGHNDTSYRYSPLGTWDDETTDSFKGALKYIAELADEYAPDATLFVLTPLWTTEAPSTLKVPENTTDNNWMFVDAIYEGAEAYGWIPVNMDLCGITPFTKSGLLLDNIHPNEAGTEKIVAYLSAELASYSETSKKETIIFNASAVSMKPGESTTLKAVLSPRSGTGTMTFTWSSSDSSVATVDGSGKITAVAPGTAVITATAPNGISADISVSVVCKHTYEPSVTAPTCTEQGYTTYTCECGDSYVADYVDATGEHTWGNWAELVAPTCDAEGTDRRICETCSEEQYRDTRITGDPNRILVSNPLTKDYFAGKRVLLIGDSITAGVGTTKTYGVYLAESLGVTVTNKGSSGSGYCSGGAMATNKNLTEANVRNADISTIMLGVNDWDWAVKEGSWKGNPEYYDKSQTYYQLGDFNSTDTSTFYGALHAWCQKILAMQQIEGFEDKQFIVITPLITSWNVSVTSKKDWNQDKLNIHGHTFREYCTAIMEVCSYYDIPVFDANMFSGIYYRSATDNNVAETGGDGVHVNAEGHALLAQSMVEFLMDGYSYETRTVADGGHTYVDGICEECRLPKPGPVITQQPESVEQEIGRKFAITVKAEGEGLTYQWYVKETGAKEFKVSSNKTASYAYTMQSYMHNRQVYCVITDTNGDSVQTETATITRPPVALTIIEQPKDGQANIGEKFSISPKVEGDGLTYQWYVKEAGAKAFKVSCNKTSAYAYTMQSYMKGRQVYCVITDKYGNSVTTDVATISLPPVELKILEQPIDVYASKGEKFSISPKVQGEGLTYQWYYKEGYMKDFKPSSNKTSAYVYSMQAYMNERSVYCVITDKYGNQVQTEVVTIHLEK